MNYNVNILDTVDSTHNTALELAIKNSIVLSYKGSDQKEDLKIVGSFLKFTMLVPAFQNVDGALINLFTADEQRFKIELRRIDDDFLIWQGFLLPESYNEPYKAGNLPINFEAVDGLGRLKGKYLPDEYYTTEKSVIEFITACLNLTGLAMPFYFSPSIENFHQPLFHTIYLHGKDFTDGNKLEDAYSILETLANDLIFCVFQSLGFWYLEGLNKRNLRVYKANHYASDGQYIGEVEITRTLKSIDADSLKTPNVGIVPPYKSVTVTYEREEVSFSDNVQQETNNGWTNSVAVNGTIYALDWIGTFFTKAKTPNYNIFLDNNFSGAFDASKYVKLLDKVYLSKDQKISLEFGFKIADSASNQNNQSVTEWLNPIIYAVTFNNDVVFTNQDVSPSSPYNVYFRNNEKTQTLNFEYTAPSNGILDVTLYQPFADFVSSQLLGIELSQFNIEEIAAEKEEIFTDSIAEEFTNELDIDITFSDDAGAYGKSFRLQPLDAFTENSNTITVPVLFSFTQSGKHYSAVELAGANLIQEQTENVTHSTEANIEILDIIYNFAAGESMLIETNIPDLQGEFVVEQFFKADPPVDRTAWQEWTDSVFRIERLRFAEIHTKIYRRMFSVPFETVDVTVKNLPMVFNTMVQWRYRTQSNWLIANFRAWNIDTGRLQLTLARALYQNNNTDTGGDNIPPFVDAGEDIFITDTQTQVTLIAVAEDPDGFIASWQWTQVTTENGVQFSNAITDTTEVTGLTEDLYTFQITVTDNEGATASDTVNVIRQKDHELLLNIDPLSEFEAEQDFQFRDFRYNLELNPELLDGVNLNIAGTFLFNLNGSGQDFQLDAIFEVFKNGIKIINDFASDFDLVDGVFIKEVPYNFSVNRTDTIQIRLFVQAQRDEGSAGSGAANLDFNINEVSVITGNVNITNALPIVRTQTANV